MNRTSRKSDAFSGSLVGGLVAVCTLAGQPVLAADLDTVEKFSLQGAILVETDDGAGTMVAVTVPVKGNLVGSGSSITFEVVNGTGYSHPTYPSVFDNSSATFTNGGLCATKYGTATVTIPDTKNSSITMTLSGIGCSDGTTGLDSLTWIITSGAGRFLGAVGTGHLSYSWGPAAGSAPAASILDLEGTIQRL